MKILLIEDDLEITRILSLSLKAAGYTVDIATDGEKGRFLALTNNYNLIILDYNLPTTNGDQILKDVRAEKKDLPVIMLTVRSEVNDKVDLLNSGADDYLTKPFAMSELLARIKSILRRQMKDEEKILKVGDLELDMEALTVKYKNRDVDLTSKEFSLLAYLMKNKNKIISRQTIMDNVWDFNADPFSNTVEVHVMRIRQKINDKKKKIIFTSSNRGYKIVDES